MAETTLDRLRRLKLTATAAQRHQAEQALLLADNPTPTLELGVWERVCAGLPAFQVAGQRPVRKSSRRRPSRPSQSTQPTTTSAQSPRQADLPGSPE